MGTLYMSILSEPPTEPRTDVLSPISSSEPNGPSLPVTPGTDVDWQSNSARTPGGKILPTRVDMIFLLFQNNFEHVSICTVLFVRYCSKWLVRCHGPSCLHSNFVIVAPSDDLALDDANVRPSIGIVLTILKANFRRCFFWYQQFS